VEAILNLAWAVCSLGLISLWMRSGSSRTIPRNTQILALAMIVLMLLPVISLSDDLMAMQGPAETDSSMRRVLDNDQGHPSVVPAAMGMPEQIFSAPPTGGWSQDSLQSYNLAPAATFLTRSLDSRPPPRA
jgi:hypothetical protein